MELLFGRDLRSLAALLKGDEPEVENKRVNARVLKGAKLLIEQIGEDVFFKRLTLGEENWQRKRKEDPSYERPRGIVEIYCMTPEEHVEFLGRRDTHDLWSPEKQKLTLQEPQLSARIGELEGVMMFSNNEHVAEVASQEYELLSYLCGRAEIIVYVD